MPLIHEEIKGEILHFQVYFVSGINPYFFFYKILKNIYLFILLCQALVVARVTFDFHCGMQDL